jgi:hypothetical protein
MGEVAGRLGDEKMGFVVELASCVACTCLCSCTDVKLCSWWWTSCVACTCLCSCTDVYLYGWWTSCVACTCLCSCTDVNLCGWWTSCVACSCLCSCTDVNLCGWWTSCVACMCLCCSAAYRPYTVDNSEQFSCLMHPACFAMNMQDERKQQEHILFPGL